MKNSISNISRGPDLKEHAAGRDVWGVAGPVMGLSDDSTSSGD